MSRKWTASQVVGLDISPKSIEIAKELFGLPRVSFVEGTLVTGALSGKFDLIVLMDVYEHVSIADRPGLHQVFKELCTDSARIVLSFPTPRCLAWLRQDHPDQIQPVDEDISIEITQHWRGIRKPMSCSFRRSISGIKGTIPTPC